jgi:dihydroorotase-like cyclic amidohydrolase
MSEFDLILRGGSVVTATGVLRADIGLSGEAITALAPELAGASREVINADGLHVFSRGH